MFYDDSSTTEISALTLHADLPIRISSSWGIWPESISLWRWAREVVMEASRPDLKWTRLHSSHDQISYAVFCLKKQKGWAGPMEAPDPNGPALSMADNRRVRLWETPPE